MSSDKVQIKARHRAGKALKFDFGGVHSRVVAIDLSDAAFEPVRPKSRVQWRHASTSSRGTAQSAVGTALSYVGDTEDAGLVETAHASD